MLRSLTDKELGRLSIKPKMLLLAFGSFMGLVLIQLLLFNAISRELYHERKVQTQQLTETGLGVVRHFYELERSGTLSREEAQAEAMGALEEATYGDSGYFWINDTDGVILMHPYMKELIGTSTLDTTDYAGEYIYREFVDKAKRGGGWVDYHWPKPVGQQPHRKISYVLFFAPWGWVIGTGIYLDDMEAEIASITLHAVMVTAAVSLVLILISLWLSSRFFRQLAELAVRDPLSSLMTRRSLFEEIPLLISSHDRALKNNLAVIFFDIDYFKQINDIYGHEYGDRVISMVGSSILQVIRSEDVAVRYGGEEFVVAMLCNSKEEALQVAERIRAAVAAIAFRKGEEEFSVTMSGGVAFREPGELFEAVLQRADVKLYEAKSSGRNRLFS